MPFAVEEGEREQRHADTAHRNVATQAFPQCPGRWEIGWWRGDVADIVEQPEVRHVAREQTEELAHPGHFFLVRQMQTGMPLNDVADQLANCGQRPDLARSR